MNCTLKILIKKHPGTSRKVKNTVISEFYSKIVITSKETNLYTNENSWAKSGEKSKFDVLMGSFNDAEVCELIGLIMLNKIISAENSKKEILHSIAKLWII
jgi:hypothetical protein